MTSDTASHCHSSGVAACDQQLGFVDLMALLFPNSYGINLTNLLISLKRTWVSSHFRPSVANIPATKSGSKSDKWLGRSFLFSTHFCIIKAEISLSEEHAPQKEIILWLLEHPPSIGTHAPALPKKLEVEEHALERLTFLKVWSISILYFDVSEYH